MDRRKDGSSLLERSLKLMPYWWFILAQLKFASWCVRPCAKCFPLIISTELRNSNVGVISPIIYSFMRVREVKNLVYGSLEAQMVELGLESLSLSP